MYTCMHNIFGTQRSNLKHPCYYTLLVLSIIIMFVIIEIPYHSWITTADNDVSSNRRISKCMCTECSIEPGHQLLNKQLMTMTVLVACQTEYFTKRSQEKSNNFVYLNKFPLFASVLQKIEIRERVLRLQVSLGTCSDGHDFPADDKCRIVNELINGHPVILLQTQMDIVWPETHFILIDKHVIAINFLSQTDAATHLSTSNESINSRNTRISWETRNQWIRR